MMALTGTALATDAVSEHDTNATESFDVSNLTIDDGENVTVTADIDNPGDEPAIQAVELRVDGELIETRDWALNPNETEQITFELSANATEALNLTDDSIVSVQTDEHGEVAVFGASQSPEASITFEDQTSDGASVTVANASSSETPYYTAVWTVNEAGEPETLLGAAQITDNETTNQTVEFDEPINESQTLVAAVHPDEDGDAGTVDPVADEILASDTANVTVEMPVEASITFEDQTSDGATVTVANASSTETPYYTAVWTVNNETGEPETLLGAAQVDTDETTNQTVAFDEPINESQTLVAAVHPDADGDVSTVDPVAEEILASDTANVTVEQPVEASITFEDQTSDGATVTVANASSSETPYYAAVWTVSETGEPETLLGAAQVTENETSDQTVAFDEPINESQTLVAAVHPDADGDASTVDPVAEDILASDTANVTVEPPAEAAITFEDQTSDGASVTVANASNSETPYYAAVWTVSETGEPDEILGVSQIDENETSDLMVAFEESIDESQTLIAAVHPDADGNASTVDPVAEDIRASDTANVTVEATEPPTEASITFEDQTSDGASVVVADAANPESPYYAAVWTVSETGEPETLLGAAQVTDNESSDIEVAFEEPINESQTLVAAVHPDEDGNASTVDPVADDIRASDTANVTVDANGTSAASLTFENQTSDGTTVTVANASFDEPPFYVAIYGANESEEMTMIGLQQIIEDQATNLTITLDEPLTESGSIVAAIHADEDGDAGTIDPVTEEFLNLVTATVTVESEDTNTTSTATATP